MAAPVTVKPPSGRGPQTFPEQINQRDPSNSAGAWGEAHYCHLGVADLTLHMAATDRSTDRETPSRPRAQNVNRQTTNITRAMEHGRGPKRRCAGGVMTWWRGGSVLWWGGVAWCWYDGAVVDLAPALVHILDQSWSNCGSIAVQFLIQRAPPSADWNMHQLRLLFRPYRIFSTDHVAFSDQPSGHFAANHFGDKFGQVHLDRDP